MRRDQFDDLSQPIQNLLLNPAFESAGTTVTTRINYITHPSFGTSASTVNARTNLCINPRGVNAFDPYAGGVTITPNVSVTDHPEGITTANRVTYGTGSNNLGVALANPLTSGTTYTVSAWVYHESAGGVQQAFAQAGVSSQTPPPAIEVGVWRRYSWTHTASGTSHLGFRVTSTTAPTSFLITGVVVEARSDVGPFFDGSTPIANLCANPTFATGTANFSTISANLTRITTKGDGHVGELTQTVAGGVRQSALYIFPEHQKPNNYAVSFDFAGTDASFTNVRCFLYDTVTSTVVSQSLLLTLNKDGDFHRYNFAFTATAPFDRIYMEVLGTAIPIGTKAWIDRVLIERGVTKASPYFDGLGDFTYEWTGTANASTSIQKASANSGWAHLGAFYRTTQDTYSGTYAGAITTRGLNGDGVWPSDITVVASRVYTFSAYVKTTSTHELTVGFRWKDGVGGTQVGADTNVVVTGQTTIGEWRRITATATAPAGAAGVQMLLRIYQTHTPTTFLVDNAMFTDTITALPYFDGATPAAGDFTYIWQGTANASASYQQASRTEYYVGGGAHAIRSSDWSASGGYSCRHMSVYQSAGSAYIDLKTTGSLKFGVPYTLLATCRIAELPINTTGRQLAILMYGGGAHKYSVVPNAVGVHPMRLKFTLPEGLTSYYLRLYNGAASGDADCWWDNIMLVEGDYDGDYIDGTKSFAKWEGAVNSSLSVGYPPQFIDIAGKPTREVSSTPTSGASIQSSNPAPDMGPRTAYFVYETFGMSTSYQGSNTYGSTATGRISLQSQAAGLDAMGVRMDFPGGENNRVTVLNGLRKAKRHVICAVVNDGLTSASVCADGGPDVTFSINGGTGWAGNDYISAGMLSETVGLTTIVFNAEHDRATRVAISRYLGNKYGANVA